MNVDVKKIKNKIYHGGSLNIKIYYCKLYE